MKRNILLVAAILGICALVIVVATQKHGSRRHLNSQTYFSATLAPLKYVVNEITGGDFPVEILLPPGSNPETYEPLPKQIVAISNSNALFSIGLMGFEQSVVGKLSPQTKIVNLSEGIKLIENHSHITNSEHFHGKDPHVWTSPQQLLKMTRAVYDFIIKTYPDSVRYTDNYNILSTHINSVDSCIRKSIELSNVRSFLIYHPALSYYAQDYGLEQIAIEEEGKEPSAQRLKALVQLIKEKDLKKILYQKGSNMDVINAIAAELGVQPVEIDPLGEDILNNIIHITCIITSK